MGALSTLNLQLRDEFLGPNMPGTAIALRRQDKTGAAQQGPEQILSITYPTADVQTALRAVSTRRAHRPVVLMGERGRGKSRIMAVMHHAVESPDLVEAWAKDWGNRPNVEGLRDLALQRGFVAFSVMATSYVLAMLVMSLVQDVRRPRSKAAA